MRSRQIWPPFLALLVLLAPSLSAFKPQYHAKITEDALKHVTHTIGGHSLQFTPRAIEEIVAANVGQDNGWDPCVIGGSPRSPFADSRNHFDSERLADAASLLRDRLNEARGKLKLNTPRGQDARKLLGQVLHALQDYYAHSNCVERDHTSRDVRDAHQQFLHHHSPLMLRMIRHPGAPRTEPSPANG